MTSSHSYRFALVAVSCVAVCLCSSLGLGQSAVTPGGIYRITPVRPIEQLRKEALRATPPKEEGKRAPDLAELVKLDSGIKLDIRYATSDNFLSTPVYTQARAFLQRPAAEALVRVNKKLRPQGYGLIIHDAYRPWYVTKVFWDATPADKHSFVANPAEGSKHNRGCAVDLSLYDIKTGKEVEMPSVYDEMTERAYSNYPGGTDEQRERRKILREVMESEGFIVNPEEWWHFDYKAWAEYPLLNTPFEKLAGALR